MESTKTFIFGRGGLARTLMAAGYVIKEVPNPYNAQKHNWVIDLAQPGSAETIYNYLTDNGYHVPYMIVDSLKKNACQRGVC